MAIQAANLALRIAGLCERFEAGVRAEQRIEGSHENARRLELSASRRSCRESEARRLAEAPLSAEEIALIENELGGRQ